MYAGDQALQDHLLILCCFFFSHPFAKQITKTDEKILTILTYVFLALSIIGSSNYHDNRLCLFDVSNDTCSCKSRSLVSFILLDDVFLFIKVACFDR